MVCHKWREAADDDANWCWMMEQEHDAASAASAREGLATYKYCFKQKALEIAEKRRAQRHAEGKAGNSYGMRLHRAS